MNLKNSLAVLFLSVVLFSCKQTEKKIRPPIQLNSKNWFFKKAN